jgi:hypothetical protein
MSVSGYNLIPGVNDEHTIGVEYDEQYDEISMFIGNGQDGEEITLNLEELKALAAQMWAIVSHIERQK